MMEKIQGAMRVLLASTVVQCCEAVDERLAHWRKGCVAARRERIESLASGLRWLFGERVIAKGYKR